MDRFWASEGYIKPDDLPMPENAVLRWPPSPDQRSEGEGKAPGRMIWQLMEHPDTGICARIVAFLSVFVIIVSIISFCLETVPSLRYPCPQLVRKGLFLAPSGMKVWSDSSISNVWGGCCPK